MKDSVTVKNGKPAARAVCGTCGTKMFKIVPGQVEQITQSRREGQGEYSS